MGTRFEIVVASDDEYRVRPFLEAALREIEDLHTRLTRFEHASLIAHINRNASHTPVGLDVATFELFEQATAVKRQSHGAFDITLGTGDLILDRNGHTLAFDRAGVTLDLGGIAKGYALDCAAEILRAGGIDAALLHGGTSSVLAVGAPPDRTAWRIALARASTLPYVDLCNQALSVSRPFSQIRNGYAHIIDPRSGAALPPRFLSVVLGPSACLADAWSTALAVLGERPDNLAPEWTTYIELEHD
jgi:thiamine biosynthesis lipoprotein